MLAIFGHEGDKAQDILYVNWLNMARAGRTYNPTPRPRSQSRIHPPHSLTHSTRPGVLPPRDWLLGPGPHASPVRRPYASIPPIQPNQSTHPPTPPSFCILRVLLEAGEGFVTITPDEEKGVIIELDRSKILSVGTLSLPPPTHLPNAPTHPHLYPRRARRGSVPDKNSSI